MSGPHPACGGRLRPPVHKSLVWAAVTGVQGADVRPFGVKGRGLPQPCPLLCACVFILALAGVPWGLAPGSDSAWSGGSAAPAEGMWQEGPESQRHVVGAWGRAAQRAAGPGLLL